MVMTTRLLRLEPRLGRPLMLGRVPDSVLDRTRRDAAALLGKEIFDSVASTCSTGDIAYIGGAFGEGLHNILEAATFGMPIVFGRGKDNHKYQEAVDLIDLGGAFEISDSLEVKKVLDRLLDDEANLESASKICSDYVNKNAGATERIMDNLINYLN